MIFIMGVFIVTLPHLAGFDNYEIRSDNSKGVKYMTNAKRTQKIVHIDYEEKMSLASAAEFLHTVATKLKDEQSFTLTLGGKTHHVTPASNVELEVKLEEKNGEFEFEVELEWKEGDEGQGLKIS